MLKWSLMSARLFAISALNNRRAVFINYQMRNRWQHFSWVMNIILFAFSIVPMNTNLRTIEQYFMHSRVYPMFHKICFNSASHWLHTICICRTCKFNTKFVSNHCVAVSSSISYAWLAPLSMIIYVLQSRAEFEFWLSFIEIMIQWK